MRLAESSVARLAPAMERNLASCIRFEGVNDPVSYSSVLQRFQILDEIAFLLLSQSQAEELVVVLGNIPQRGKTAIMIKAAFLMSPKSCQRRGAKNVRGRAIRLKRIHPDLARRVEVIPRLREQWRDVAASALALGLEYSLPPPGRFRVEASYRRGRRRDGELIEVKGGQLRGDLVWLSPSVTLAALRRNGVLRLIVEPGIKECPRAVHLGSRDIRVPVGN